MRYIINKRRMIMTYTVTHKGIKVDCYNSVEDNSNFEIICEDENNDTIWIGGNPDTEYYAFSSWEEVVAFFIDELDISDIVEITAV
jgi:hypothetical protein